VYHILFETGNDRFTVTVIKKFSSVYVKTIVNLCESNLQGSGVRLNRNAVDQLIKKNKEKYTVFNCTLNPDTGCCKNAACRKKHKAVITNEQLRIFSNEMAEEKNNYARTHYSSEEKKKLWLEITQVFESLKASNFSAYNYMKIIIENATNHNEYLNEYINRTNKRLAFATGCAYICAETAIGSDYPEFERNTKLANVVACEVFQN